MVTNLLESRTILCKPELLKRQVENAEDSDWNPAMASATCVALIAQNVTDQIIPYAVSFIERHISNALWRDREAAVMSFGKHIV
jgi:hypothetical protein